jgi:hypothetical protein
MKIFITLFLLIAIGFGVWFFIFRQNTGSTNQGANLPYASSTQVVHSSGGETTSTTETVYTPDEVARQFTTNISNSNKISLYKTTVIGDYALQEWADENKGGQALLRYSGSTGWIIITMGGGAWNAAGLIEQGVPKDVAERLIAQAIK